ncbi:MAG: cyclic nucleotide-binding domain-containing protein [Proteobacteria bacterium]|nr:cyclic nucleotide-binding domain-containing protein [Pseudomonadota bacterium]
MKSNKFIQQLQSNCVLVSTRSIGEILFGCPPGIVKWFIGRGRPIPSVVVLPRDFLIDNRLNVEPEFPIYGNFFIQKRRVTIIGTGDQLRRIKRVFRESFLGPRGVKEGKRERDFLSARTEDGKALKVEDLVNLIPFRRDREGVRIDGVTIKTTRPGYFEIWEAGVLLGEVDTTVFKLPSYPPDLFKEKPLEPPTFGVSFVGTGSGFNPFRRTTSFILWVNGKGIFVDPVTDPWVELNKLGIEDMDVPSVLLTHCHADHDAGMIRAAIHQRRIRLITSRVVFESFSRKAKALAGFDIEKYVDFVEINPGDTYELGNASIRVSSALHPIPTIRFESRFDDGRSKKPLKIAYSGDTCLNRNKIETMYRRSIIDEERLNELLHFGFDADLYIHEAGEEAIHTSVEEFQRLPEQIREKLILVHAGDLPRDLKGLRVAQEGETVELIPATTSSRDVIELIASNSIFEGLKREAIVRIAEQAALIPFKAGQNLVTQGEKGDRFYLIALGRAKVLVDNAMKAVLGKGDYFGEISLLSGKPRNATVQAISDGSVLAIGKETFLEVAREEPSVNQRLQSILTLRPIISRLTFLKDLPADQLARLSICFEKYSCRKGDRIVEQEQRGDAFFILTSGRAIVQIRDKAGCERIVAELGPGDVFGEIALLRNIPRTATVEITSDSAELLELRERDFHSLMGSIPSLSFYLNRISSERLRKLAKCNPDDLDGRLLRELA